MNVWKVIIISAAVSANMIIWHEVLGINYLLAIGGGILVLVLFSPTK